MILLIEDCSTYYNTLIQNKDNRVILYSPKPYSQIQEEYVLHLKFIDLLSDKEVSVTKQGLATLVNLGTML